MDEGMRIALEEARLAYLENEVPVGAALYKDGVLLARAHNHREKNVDISSHAEIEVLREGARILGSWSLEGCTLYVTLEPCLMCLGAIFQARVSTLEYASDDEKEGAFSFYRVQPKPNLLVYRGEGKEEASALLASFFYQLRDRKPL